MQIDCTLNSFSIPGFSGISPDFGIKKPIGETISSREEHVNVAMPFTLMRPHIISENSTTTEIEVNSVFEFTQGGISLALSEASYNGCQIIIINTADAPSTVIMGGSGHTIDPLSTLRLGYVNGWRVSSYEAPEGGGGTPGEGDNTTISEENLLTVLGVSTVADAIDELHNRLNNSGSSGPYLGGLKLGMYLDLAELNDGSTVITKNDSYQNLRIRIAGFNHYKNYYNTRDHIVFEFKHIPITKQMRTANTNDGGYPKSSGDVVFKPYLEGGFLTGLRTALGITIDKAGYIYTVRRNVTQGQNGAWTKTEFDAAIFPPCEKEVFGSNSYGDATTEADLTQLPIYARGQSKVKNYNGSASNWWEGSPYAGTAAHFCYVNGGGNANAHDASYAYGCSPCFPLS